MKLHKEIEFTSEHTLEDNVSHDAQFVVMHPGDFRIEQVRDVMRKAMCKRYEGWDDDFDRQFDDRTVWFALEAGEEYVATCKLIFKSHNETWCPTPIELGDLAQHDIPERHPSVCEGGGVSYTDQRYAIDLMYGIGEWMLEQNIGPCYTTYDVTNPVIQKLYTRVLGFQEVVDAQVSFSSFLRKKTGAPAQWQVVRLPTDPTFVKRRMRRLEKLGAKPIYHNICA